MHIAAESSSSALIFKHLKCNKEKAIAFAARRNGILEMTGLFTYVFFCLSLVTVCKLRAEVIIPNIVKIDTADIRGC